MNTDYCWSKDRPNPATGSTEAERQAFLAGGGVVNVLPDLPAMGDLPIKQLDVNGRPIFKLVASNRTQADNIKRFREADKKIAAANLQRAQDADRRAVELASEYINLTDTGIRERVKVLAKRHGIDPRAVNHILLRARKLGLLMSRNDKFVAHQRRAGAKGNAAQSIARHAAGKLTIAEEYRLEPTMEAIERMARDRQWPTGQIRARLRRSGIYDDNTCLVVEVKRRAAA